jgi:hypothetical protein
MTHEITLEVPDEIYQPLLKRAQEQGQTIETVARECLAASVNVAPGSLLGRWIGAFESDVPDAAERHHEYLGQALHEEMQGRSGD